MNQMLYVIQSEVNIWNSFWALPFLRWGSWVKVECIIFLWNSYMHILSHSFRRRRQINFCVQMIICLPPSSFAPSMLTFFVAEPVRRGIDPASFGSTIVRQRDDEVESRCYSCHSSRHRGRADTMLWARAMRWRLGQAGRRDDRSRRHGHAFHQRWHRCRGGSWWVDWRIDDVAAIHRPQQRMSWLVWTTTPQYLQSAKRR